MWWYCYRLPLANDYSLWVVSNEVVVSYQVSPKSPSVSNEVAVASEVDSKL